MQVIYKREKTISFLSDINAISCDVALIPQIYTFFPGNSKITCLSLGKRAYLGKCDFIQV